MASCVDSVENLDDLEEPNCVVSCTNVTSMGSILSIDNVIYNELLFLLKGICIKNFGRHPFCKHSDRTRPGSIMEAFNFLLWYLSKLCYGMWLGDSDWSDSRLIFWRDPGRNFCRLLILPAHSYSLSSWSVWGLVLAFWSLKDENLGLSGDQTLVYLAERPIKEKIWTLTFSLQVSFRPGKRQTELLVGVSVPSGGQFKN